MTYQHSCMFMSPSLNKEQSNNSVIANNVEPFKDETQTALVKDPVRTTL